MEWHLVGSKNVGVDVKGMSIELALMQELKRWYKKNVMVPGVTEPYDWSFDVTDLVIESGLIKNVEKAYYYGWYDIRGYSYAGKERPPDRLPQEIVRGWLNGIELALLKISTEDYNISEEYAGWYWVTVPCKFKVISSVPPVTPAQQVPFWVWIILALLGLGLLSKR